MGPRPIGGTANSRLLARIAGVLGVAAEECLLEQFPEVESLSAVAVLAEALQPLVGESAVVGAPDLGS